METTSNQTFFVVKSMTEMCRCENYKRKSLLEGDTSIFYLKENSSQSVKLTKVSFREFLQMNTSRTRQLHFVNELVVDTSIRSC
mmetsp:Transcript_34655/g.53030  ORF Transcript_34655/g.53030 Transcript_34655/m.53030 type:complete len:84 (+) Transcript_34655:3267-3518(+)